MTVNLAASAMVDFNASVAGLKVGLDQAARVVENNFKKMESAGKKLTQAMQGIAFGYTITGALRAADSYNTLQTRIERATRATGDYVGVSNELFKISQQTGASLKDTTDVFQRLSLAAGNLGASNKQLVDLTATVEKLGVMGGASASALNAGLLQFGQAMGAGVVHAEEFNSLIENIPLVADKIAKGMGMTTASLRSAVLEGKVLSKDVFESLMKQAPEVAKEFAKLPPSLERSLSSLQGAFSKALGELDSSVGLTRTLAQGLNLLADNAKAATNGIVGMAVGVGVFKLLTFNYQALAVAATEAAIAMSANPMVGLAAAVGVGVAAMIAFKDVTFELMDQQVSLSSLGQAVWEQIAKAAQETWRFLSDAAAGFGKTCEALWKFLGDGFDAVFKQIGDAAKWVVDGALIVIQGFVDAVSKIPIIGDKFKEWGGAIEQAGSAAQGTIDSVKAAAKGATDGVVGFAKTIVGRAAEIEKAKQQISAPISTKVQGGNPLAEWDKKAKEFFQHQMDINEAMLAGLTISKEAAELEKLKAEFAKKVKREMEDGELKILEQIVENRRAMATLNDFNGMSEQMRQEADALGLQNTELEYQIPLLEQINKLKQEGRAFTDEQIAALKAQAKANYDAAKQMNIARDFEKFKKDMNQELDFLDQRKNYTEEEIAIQRELNALKDKGYSEQQLNEAEALLAAKSAREKYNDVLKQTNALLDANRDAFKDLITDKSLKNQIDMYDEVMKAVGKDWRKGQALSPNEEAWARGVAAQKTFLEDAKRAQDIIKESRTEQQKWADDLDELNKLAQQGLLTFDQWSEAVKKASPEYKKIRDFAEDTAKSFTNALDDWIFKGKKLSEVFKDLTKNLAQNVAKKAIFEPLEKKMTDLISGALWKNKAPQYPGMPGTGPSNPLFGGLPFKLPFNNPSTNPFGPLASLPGGSNGWLPGGGIGGGPGGFGGSFANNPSITAGQATIYVSGPITVNGGGVTLGGNGGGTGGGLLDGLKNMLSNTFNGIASTLKNIISIPMNMLSSLFGGGDGSGLMGGLSKILGIVTNPLGGLLGGAGLGFNMGGGGLGGILPGIAGGLGGLLGGVIGSGRGLMDIFRYNGGPVSSGKSYIVGERGPEMFTPGTGGYISTNADTNAILTGNRGTPLYQQMQGFTPDFSVFNQWGTPGATGMEGYELQELMRKYELLKSVGKEGYRQLGYGEWTNDEMGRMMQILSFQNLGVKEQARQWYGDAMQAGAQAYLSGNVQGASGNDLSWAADLSANKTWANVSQAQGNTFAMQMPLGNQLGNTFNKWAHRGVAPGELLGAYGNTRDWGMDWLERISGVGAAGGWKGQSYGYSSMGMGGGFGTGGETNEKPIKWGSYNQEWGSGVGQLQGWMPTGSPFRNNSLLETGGNGVTQNVPGWTPFQYDPTKPWNQAKNNPTGVPGWSPVPQFMPGQTGVYGSPRNASGGHTIDPYTGNKLPWQSALDFLSMMGYRPESGWSLGDWFNTLHSMSSYMGFKQPNMGYQRNIGTGFPSNNIYSIPGYAQGGRPAVGKLSLVGEEGPELFVPDVAGKVVPFKKPGLNGGVNVSVKIIASHDNFTVTQTRAPNGDPEIIIQEVLARAYNQKGKFANAVKNTRAIGRG